MSAPKSFDTLGVSEAYCKIEEGERDEGFITNNKTKNKLKHEHKLNSLFEREEEIKKETNFH